MSPLERVLVDTKLGVHVLVCVFAVSSWVDLNGMWVELPIFVTNLPEKWTLPSYITVLAQVANIGPIVFFVVAYCLAKTSVSKLTLDKVTSYAIMLVGLSATLLLAFLWQRTAEVAGQERSVALLALSFFLALMDCTSSMAFIAFLATLKPLYMPSFFLGEGLSGLLPALLALAQGAGDIVCVNVSSTEARNVSGTVVNMTTYSRYPSYLPPRFSVRVFFLLLSGMIATSLAAFSLLNFWGYCKDQFVAAASSCLQEGEDGAREKSAEAGGPVEGRGVSNPALDEPAVVSNSFSYTAEHNGLAGSAPGSAKSAFGSSGPGSYGSQATESGLGSFTPTGRCGEGVELVSKRGPDVSMVTTCLLLTQVVVINFLGIGILLSVQVYSSLPYGISTYNLVVTLTSIANPVACLTSLFLAVSSPWAISSLTSLGVACGAYIIVAATMSPYPPMVEQAAGGPVVVVIWIGASFFLTYAKVSAAGVMRLVGRRALIWYGAATQLGGLLGAVTGFVLVDQLKVFKDASWC